MLLTVGVSFQSRCFFVSFRRLGVVRRLLSTPFFAILPSGCATLHARYIPPAYRAQPMALSLRLRDGLLIDTAPDAIRHLKNRVHERVGKENESAGCGDAMSSECSDDRCLLFY